MDDPLDDYDYWSGLVERLGRFIPLIEEQIHLLSGCGPILRDQARRDAEFVGRLNRFRRIVEQRIRELRDAGGGAGGDQGQHK